MTIKFDTSVGQMLNLIGSPLSPHRFDYDIIKKKYFQPQGV